MKRIIASVLAVVAIGFTGLASAGGPPTKGSCTVAVYDTASIVSAVNLPVDRVVNFSITDDRGVVAAYPLGTTTDGTMDVYVDPPVGEPTYQFFSRTRGKDGTKYTVYAAC